MAQRRPMKYQRTSECDRPGCQGALQLLSFLSSVQKCRTWLRLFFAAMQEHPRRHRGRPVKYQGDPNAPGLDAEERRQLLRRIANRESARRMRKRHLDELHDLSTEVCHIALCACR